VSKVAFSGTSCGEDSSKCKLWRSVEKLLRELRFRRTPMLLDRPEWLGNEDEGDVDSWF